MIMAVNIALWNDQIGPTLSAIASVEKIQINEVIQNVAEHRSRRRERQKVMIAIMKHDVCQLMQDGPVVGNRDRLS